jgi:5-methylcytosine-specific restriction endonuclease McrA
MAITALDEAAAVVEKANANLEPELMGVDAARSLLASYARIRKLASYGEAVLARRTEDASELARLSGTSMARAKETVATATRLREAGELDNAFRSGEVSLDQAGAIARTEEVRPGSTAELLEVAREKAFHVLQERARKLALEAQQHQDLAPRQHSSRSARSYTDELGMVNISVRLEPHVGTPIAARAESEAARLCRRAKAAGRREPFERDLADAYAAMLSGGQSSGRSRRAELVVLVSHEVTQRGWSDVREGEVCKIPGVGPVAPSVAKKIAQDAFLSGLFYDGKDLRLIRRWTRNIPVEVRLPLELGPPPEFDGVRCTDCGNRFGTQFDHLEPHVAHGPASTDNLHPRCWSCHGAKTERDRKAGKLKPPPATAERGPP